MDLTIDMASAAIAVEAALQEALKAMSHYGSTMKDRQHIATLLLLAQNETARHFREHEESRASKKADDPLVEHVKFAPPGENEETNS